MTVYKFQAVKYRVSKSGKCVCGKRVTRSVTLEHTINPFNKNHKGEVKTYSEIWQELRQEAAEWKAKPAYHNRVFGYNFALAEKGTAVLTCGQQIPMNDWS